MRVIVLRRSATGCGGTCIPVARLAAKSERIREPQRRPYCRSSPARHLLLCTDMISEKAPRGGVLVRTLIACCITGAFVGACDPTDDLAFESDVACDDDCDFNDLMLDHDAPDDEAVKILYMEDDGGNNPWVAGCLHYFWDGTEPLECTPETYQGGAYPRERCVNPLVLAEVEDEGCLGDWTVEEINCQKLCHKEYGILSGRCTVANDECVVNTLGGPKLEDSARCECKLEDGAWGKPKAKDGGKKGEEKKGK